MTRKDYELIAENIREAYTYYDKANIVPAEVRAHKRSVVMVARLLAKALSDQSGYDNNGNRRFDFERFYLACGIGEYNA